MATILAVDDEEDMLETVAYNLQRAGHTVVCARTAQDALQLLEDHTPELIISDIMMPGMDGLAFCRQVRARPRTALTPFLFVTAKSQPSDKYAGLRAGADDYVAKPFELTDLLARVNGRLEHRARMSELEDEAAQAQSQWQEASDPLALRQVRAAQREIVERAQQAGYTEYQLPSPSALALENKVLQFERRFPILAALRATSLVGNAPNFLRIFEEILIAAATPDPVLILGETGTGKTAVADAIWRLGPRAARVFRTINCSELAAGDPTIASSKLFGIGRHSGLPGLTRDGQPGLLQQTHGGVLFLDEVGDLPRQAQTLLLLPLEGRPFRPAVGSGEDQTVDVKFIAATNRNLDREVGQGGFPRDLYERFAGHVLHVPPLRDRVQDIPLLATWLLGQFEAQQEVTTGAGISASAMAALQAYGWPGNVRELRRVIRQAAQRARLDGRARIERRDLPDAIADAVPRERRSGTQQSVPLPALAAGASTAAPAWTQDLTPTPLPVLPGLASPPTSADTTAVPTVVEDPPSVPRLARSVPVVGASGLPNPVDDTLRAGGFSDRELAELGALRACGFRVGDAEVRLGYSSKSRTFSHRLRGISFKALCLCRFDTDRAAHLLAGGDPALAAVCARRLRALLESVSTRGDDAETKIMANLLHEHRQYAQEALAFLRQRAR